MTAIKPQAANYQAQRRDSSSFFSYGLSRRFAEIKAEFDEWLCLEQRFSPPSATLDSTVTVLDFGCGDASMLDALIEGVPGCPIVGTGLDTFRGVKPTSRHQDNVVLVDCDLRQAPYPIVDRSVDFAIVSAFLKHNPQHVLFLRELARVLTIGGRAVLLDPTPAALRIGLWLHYFDRRYLPFAWSARRLATILHREQIGLEIVTSRKYWLAPNQTVFDSGIEQLVPVSLRNRMGLHQCVVLQPKPV